MKMIRAIIRPGREAEIALVLGRVWCGALTRWDVLGRGRQRGIQLGSAVHGELRRPTKVFTQRRVQHAKTVEIRIG